jgi:hypothetical protein
VFDSGSRPEDDFDADTVPRGINSNGGSSTSLNFKIELPRFSPMPSMPMIAPGEGLGYILSPIETSRREIFMGIYSKRQRATRGGSWNNSARRCQAANRNRRTPDNRNRNQGFRVGLFPGTKIKGRGHRFRTSYVPYPSCMRFNNFEDDARWKNPLCKTSAIADLRDSVESDQRSP